MLTKLTCAIGSGLCVAYFPGTLAWLVPAAALSSVVVYEATTPPEERGALRALAVSRARALLPARTAQPDSLGAGLRWFGALPARDKAAFLLGRPGAPEYAPALPAPAVEASDRGAPGRRGGAEAAFVRGGREAGPPASPRPRWLEVVNDAPDQHPHALILGPTGAGKTTLATAIMGDRGGRAVVISPKVTAGAWRGAEVVTLDDDASYAPLSRALAELEQEKRERVVTLRKRGRDALEPLTVVFDELQDLTAHVPEAGEFMVNMASLGREIKMRLIGIGTTDDALNIRGWKASRRNYARIELTSDRRASLSDGVRTIPIGTGEVVRRASEAQLRPWRGEPGPAIPPRELRMAERWVLEAPPEPATLSREELARVAPSLARKRGYVSADDTATLAALLGLDAQPPDATQSLTVEHGVGGGNVIVNVHPTTTRPRAPRRRAVDVKDRRRRLAYIEAARAGEKFEPTYQRLKGSRNEMWALFTEHKPK